MTIRTAHGGGTAVRWVYGAFIALCAALAVLVHHETAVTGTSPMTGSSTMATSHASSMPSTAPAVPVPGEETPTAWEPSSTHSLDTGGCGVPGVQHCTTASAGSVQLAALPGENEVSPLSDPREAGARRAPAGTVGRAPPDLSVLSRLRI